METSSGNGDKTNTSHNYKIDRISTFLNHTQYASIAQSHKKAHNDTLIATFLFQNLYKMLLGLLTSKSLAASAFSSPSCDVETATVPESELDTMVDFLKCFVGFFRIAMFFKRLRWNERNG